MYKLKYLFFHQVSVQNFNQTLFVFKIGVLYETGCVLTITPSRKPREFLSEGGPTVTFFCFFLLFFLVDEGRTEDP